MRKWLRWLIWGAVLTGIWGLFHYQDRWLVQLQLWVNRQTENVRRVIH